MRIFGLVGEWPGKKKYKIGPERLFFCVPPEADFQRVKDVGATIIQTYGTNWTANEGQDFLDKAEQHGLKVLYCIKSQVHDLLRAGKPWNKNECERLVKGFDSHPALWGWYVLDEPDAGEKDPKVNVPKETQRDISESFRLWTNKPLVIALRGGTRGWHLIDFSLWSIIADTYVYDGTGKCWGEKPLDALKLVGIQERAFMDKHKVDFLGFMFQSSSHPATGRKPPLYGTKVPLGQIESQFNVLNEYGLFPKLIGMYAWSGGDFCPNRDDEIYNEIKNLLDKIKEV